MKTFLSINASSISNISAIFTNESRQYLNSIIVYHIDIILHLINLIGKFITDISGLTDKLGGKIYIHTALFYEIISFKSLTNDIVYDNAYGRGTFKPQ